VQVILIDNVEAHSQIWFFEPWDLLIPEPGYLPATDTSLQDGKYRIVNVATGFLMAVNTRGPSPYLVTKQKLQNTYYITSHYLHARGKRIRGHRRSRATNTRHNAH